MAKAIHKEKYLQLLQISGQISGKSQGLSTVLTQIHHDLHDLEFECFEGPAGYQPHLLPQLEELRALSREFWNLNHSE